MRIDAIYENGKMPASKKKPKQTTDPSPIRRQLDAIMGQHAKRRPRTTYAEDKKAWQNYLNEKYGQ